MSNIRYTLAMHTDGKQVWKHWSGDREEILRIMVGTLPYLDLDRHRAVHFAVEVEALDPEQLVPGQEIGAVVLTDDLRSRITFDVRRKS